MLLSRMGTLKQGTSVLEETVRTPDTSVKWTPAGEREGGGENINGVMSFALQRVTRNAVCVPRAESSWRVRRRSKFLLMVPEIDQHTGRSPRSSRTAFNTFFSGST